MVSPQAAIAGKVTIPFCAGSIRGRMDERGYLGARSALRGAGAQLVPAPDDGAGLDVAAGRARCAHARLANVTPSHQFPLGGTLSLARRLALLAKAPGDVILGPLVFGPVKQHIR